MRNIFTHKYSVIFFEKGHFCWKVRGWEPIEDALGIIQIAVIVIFFLAVIVIGNIYGEQPN